MGAFPRMLVPALLALLLLPLTLQAAEPLADGEQLGPRDLRTYLRGSYVFGTVLQTAGFLEGENAKGEPIDTYHGIRLEFGWQTDGSRLWHHLYNYPDFGVGLMGVDFFNDEELGQPTSLFGYFNWPWFRKGAWKLYSGLGFGISTNWKNYDPKTNPYNNAIGSFRNAYIDVSFFNASYNFSPRWDLTVGFDGTHWSNGGSRQPNWGINVVGVQAFLQYRFEPQPQDYWKKEIPEYEDDNEIITTLMFGNKNIAVTVDNEEIFDKYYGNDFATVSLSTSYNRQISWMSKFSGGIDLQYDASITAAIDASDGSVEDTSTSFWDKTALGLFGGYEQVVHRGSLILQLGYTVLRKDIMDNPNVQQTPRFYQRLGLKYHFLDNTFFGLNVRFYEFSRAEYLELNLGRRWKF